MATLSLSKNDKGWGGFLQGRADRNNRQMKTSCMNEQRNLFGLNEQSASSLQLMLNQQSRNKLANLVDAIAISNIGKHLMYFPLRYPLTD